MKGEEFVQRHRFRSIVGPHWGTQMSDMLGTSTR